MHEKDNSKLFLAAGLLGITDAEKAEKARMELCQTAVTPDILEQHERDALIH